MFITKMNDNGEMESMPTTNHDFLMSKTDVGNYLFLLPCT